MFKICCKVHLERQPEVFVTGTLHPIALFVAIKLATFDEL